MNQDILNKKLFSFIVLSFTACIFTVHVYIT